MSGIASLPPHEFIRVMTDYMFEGGDLKELCSSSKMIAQKCQQHKSELLLARVKLLCIQGDTEALYRIVKQWIHQDAFLGQMYEVINNSSFGYDYEPDIEYRFGMSERIFDQAVWTKDLPMIRKLGKYTRFHPLTIKGRTTGSDPGQIRMSQWIRSACHFDDAVFDIRVLYELITVAKRVYGWSNEKLYLYANIYDPDEAHLLQTALSYYTS